MLESGSRFRLIFENQALHALLLAVLLAGAYLLTGINGFSTGSLWGISTTGWFWLAIAIAVLHQVYVWFCWRTQLHLGLLTRRLGGRAFDVYAFFFSVIGLSRLLAVFGVAISNSHTLTFDLSALRVLAVLVLIPALYLMYSVRRYFTFRRAFGIDHFDPRYRTMPMVREGIFRFTSNGMYVFGFFAFWFPALWWASIAALGAALFNHLYIWVHYFATERPDMRRIYGGA
jgi:hypothetical protein